MNKRNAVISAALTLLLAVPAAWAETKIGFVSSDRLMREAPPAVNAQKRLEKEFAKRDQELQRMAAEIQKLQEELERNGLTMSDKDRRAKERTLNELARDFKRKQSEFREDLNLRRNEELAAVLERANKAIKEIAERENYDFVIQEAVYASPKIDITDKVLKALGKK